MVMFNPFSKFLKPQAKNNVVFNMEEKNEKERKMAIEERGLKSGTSWIDIREYDINFFKDALKKIYNLSEELSGDKLVEAINLVIMDSGDAFNLSKVAEYYHLSSNASFTEIKKAKENAGGHNIEPRA